MRNKVVTVVSYILVACIASFVTFAVCAVTSVLPEDPKLTELEAIITQRYIGEVDSQALWDAAAEGMVAGTGDQWSYYVPAAEMQAHRDNQNNSYVGIGITVQMRTDDKGFDIQQVTAGGPAQEAGLLPGDIVYMVNGVKISELGQAEATNRIKGEAGTTVELTVLREEQTLVFRVERRAIEVIVATGQLLPGNIGLVTIKNFNSNCAKRTVEVIENLRGQGATSLILDVRFNPGGYRHELVKLLDYLLPEGTLFRSEYYTGQQSTDYSDASFLDMPMVVLMNPDSYSAAEFFAAALREYEAATLVGQNTTGKGYFQETIVLSDGSAVNLSTGRYFTPKGVSLAEVGGLVPDVTVEVDDETYVNIYYGLLTPEEDPQIQAAVNVLLGK